MSSSSEEEKKKKKGKKDKHVIGKYRRGLRLGSGSYGTVYDGVNSQTNAAVAIKKQRYQANDGVQQHLLRELVALAELKHQNIVQLLDVIFDRDRGRCWLILERMDLDLNNYISTLLGEDIEMRLCQSYVSQLLCGVQFCHARGLVHGDLKPQNLLINMQGDLKIADFGLARLLSGQNCIRDTEIATRWYRPPEMLLGSAVYNSALDMWSVGCIFGEMLHKKPLFPGDSEIDTLYRIFRILGTVDESSLPGVEKMPFYRNNFPKWSSSPLTKTCPDLSESGIDLLSRFLCYTDRISASEALRHPWLSETVKAENSCCLLN